MATKKFVHFFVGAAHVHRFLSMDPSILKQTAADVSDTSDSEGGKVENKSVSSSAVNQSCVTLHNAADKLRTAVTNRYQYFHRTLY